MEKEYLKRSLSDLGHAYQEGNVQIRGYRGDRTSVEVKIPTGANLKHAQIWEAQLQQTNLSKTNLENADLRKATLQGTKLGKANLKNANLSGVNL